MSRRPDEPAPQWRHVQRELQRSRSARRLWPFLLASAACAAALVALVSRSLEAGLAVLAPGALLFALLWLTSIPRCPACGGSLWRRGERPGPAGAPRPTQVERERRCPRCSQGFE
ncbi:MAG TPA: hypothetical protein VIV59_05810 [Anaeromyxobacteraceae bacterium]